MLDLIDFDKCSEKEKQYLLEMVKRNSSDIKYINNSSLEMQLEAVKQNGWVIQYINNPSEEVIKISKMSFIEKMKYFCKTE